MKKVIRATNERRKSIDQYTEEELAALPSFVTLVTRMPGASSYVPVFTCQQR